MKAFVLDLYSRVGVYLHLRGDIAVDLSNATFNRSTTSVDLHLLRGILSHVSFYELLSH